MWLMWRPGWRPTLKADGARTCSGWSTRVWNTQSRTRGERTVMSDRAMDVDAARGSYIRLLDVTAGMLEPGIRSGRDSWEPPPPRTATPAPSGAHGAPSMTWLSRRAEQRGTPGGTVPSDDDLLERTLAFSGTYVSDDGDVTIRRSLVDSTAYSAARYVGWCQVCMRADLVPASGELLSDVRAAARFVATHDHAGTD